MTVRIRAILGISSQVGLAGAFEQKLTVSPSAACL